MDYPSFGFLKHLRLMLGDLALNYRLSSIVPQFFSVHYSVNYNSINSFKRTERSKTNISSWHWCRKITVVASIELKMIHNSYPKYSFCSQIWLGASYYGTGQWKWTICPACQGKVVCANILSNSTSRTSPSHPTLDIWILLLRACLLRLGPLNTKTSGGTKYPGWTVFIHGNMTLQVVCRKVCCNRVVLVPMCLGQAIVIWQKVCLVGSLHIQIWAQTVSMLSIHGACSTVIPQYAFPNYFDLVIWGNKERQGQ